MDGIVNYIKIKLCIYMNIPKQMDGINLET